MCLLFVQECTKQNGEGYKIVRKGEEPGQYLNYYSSFPKSDNTKGRSYGSNLTLTGMSGCGYHLGRITRIRHNRWTVSEFGSRYRAGIHVWKTWHNAVVSWSDLPVGTRRLCVLIKVSWQEPFAQDNDTVAVRQVRVLEEIDMRCFTTA